MAINLMPLIRIWEKLSDADWLAIFEVQNQLVPRKKEAARNEYEDELRRKAFVGHPSVF